MLSRKLLSSLIVVNSFGGLVAQGDSFEIVPAEKLSFFVPKGFDDNDEVTVVVDGYLPSSCHKLDKLKYELDLESHRIRVEQLVRKYTEFCIEVPVPFTSELRLAPLPFGAYVLSSTNGTATQIFNVSESKNAGPDDVLYAPVEQVSIQRFGNSNQRSVVIEGRFTNTCMRWDDIKVVDSGSTVEVLPIMKMEERPDCKEIDLWFKTAVDLPTKERLGRYLVHVRSLNGRSQNRMFSVAPLLNFP